MCDCSSHPVVGTSAPAPARDLGCIRLNRRHALAAFAAGAGAFALGVFGGDGAVADAASGPLDEPATALQPAKRMSRQRKEFPVPPEGKLIFPVEPSKKIYVGNNFGACRSGGSRAHSGVDIMAPSHELIYAVVDGVISQRHVFNNTIGSGWGWTLRDAAGDVNYRYFHMVEDTVGLRVGSEVRRGDVIGYVGSTGTDSATNFHLHFEVRPGNTPVDPFPMLLIPDGVARASTADNGCLGRPMS